MKNHRRALGLVCALLVVAAALVFVPFTISILFASWIAITARPWVKSLTRILAGRSKAAAVVTTGLCLTLLVAFGAAVVPLAAEVLGLVRDVRASGAWPEAARSIVAGDGTMNIAELFRAHMRDVWGTATSVLVVSGSVLAKVAVFIATFFALSAEGDRIVAWMRDHVPMKGSHFDRLAKAYAETGRGLVIGVGLTALLQGVLATLTYFAVGIRRALALGVLTMLGALLPSGGPVLVWLPIATILALTGHPGKAAVVAASGALLIGSVDNVVKPVVARWAALKMSPILLFVTMLGGILAFGPAGLALGPLFVRLAIEALAIAKEERLVGAPTSGVPRPLIEQGGHRVAPSNVHS